jgi:hypothetical protein
MMTTKRAKARVSRVAGRARNAGQTAKARIVTATDAALVRVGRAAERRQRNRAVKSALKLAGKAAIVAGAAAASVAAGTMAVRALRRHRGAKA